MSRIMIALALVSVVALSGCIGTANYGPGGSLPGSLFNDITYPSALNPNTTHEINIERKDIDILGRVESTSESFTILGIIGQGDSGYGALLEAAKAKGADGVMNVNIDTQVQAYVFGAYLKVVTTLTGTAYKYR